MAIRPFSRLKREVARVAAQAAQTQGELKASGEALNASLLVRDEFAAAMVFDFALGNARELVLTADVTSVSLANLVPGGLYAVSVVQDGVGGRSIAWSGVQWAGGAAPALTATANARDNFMFASFDGATLSELSQAMDVS